MAWPERVALVHDRLDRNGGADQVLWALHEVFPSPDSHRRCGTVAHPPEFMGDAGGSCTGPSMTSGSRFNDARRISAETKRIDLAIEASGLLGFRMVVAGEEDFGLVALEAPAAGKLNFQTSQLAGAAYGAVYEEGGPGISGVDDNCQVRPALPAHGGVA